MRYSLQHLFIAAAIAVLCVFSFFSAVDLRMPIVIGVLLVVSVFVFVFLQASIYISITHIGWIIICYIIFTYNRAADISMKYNYFYAALVVFSICISSVYSPDDRFYRLVFGVIASIAFVCIGVILLEYIIGTPMLTLLSKVLPEDVVQQEAFRMKNGLVYYGMAFFPNVNSMAAFLMIVYAVFICDASSMAKFTLKIFCLLIGITGLLLTGERSNLLTVPAAFFVTFSLGKKSKLFMAGVGFLALAFAVYTAMPYLQEFRAFERIYDSIVNFMEGEEISNGRDVLYSTAINLWKESPLIGHGWFYFYTHNIGILVSGNYDHAHNFILELLCDLGVFGTLFFLLTLGTAFVQNAVAIKRMKNSFAQPLKAVFTMQFYFLLDSMFHVTFYTQFLVSFYFIAIGLLNSMLASNEITVRKSTSKYILQ